MQKLAIGAVSAVLCVLGSVLLAFFFLPAGPLLASAGAGFELVPTADATLSGGRALLTSPRGADLVGWRWCPGEGLSSFCVQSSGRSGFMQGVIAISPAAVTIPRMTFSGVDAAVLGVGPLFERGRLSGELAGFRLPRGERCPHRGLAAATGTINLGGVANAGDVSFEGDGERGLVLAGDLVQGNLELGESGLSGTLSLALGGPGTSTTMNVARRFDCL